MYLLHIKINGISHEHETYEDFLTLCDKIVEMQSSLLYKFRVLKCNKTLYALYI